MATVIVKRNGKPVTGANVSVVSTFGFHQYDQKARTDHQGEAELDDNANRFYVNVDGRRCETVDRLRGTIEVSL